MEDWCRKDDANLVLQAVRLTEVNVENVAIWCKGDLIEEIDPEHPEETQFGINLETLFGRSRASLGMYVVKYGSKFYAQHNRVFENQYTPVDREAPPLESAGDSRKARGWADPFDRGRMT